MLTRLRAKMELAVPELVLLRTRQSLQSLREFCDTDPFLFQAPPGEHRNVSDGHDVWAVRRTTHLAAMISHPSG
jgi:hypothetical protein